MRVDLTAAKRGVAEALPPGHPGREAVLALPDHLSEREFDSLFPLVLRLLRTPPSGGSPGAAETARAGGAGRGGKPRP